VRQDVTVPVRATPGFAQRPAQLQNVLSTLTSTCYNSMNMDLIQAAIKELESHEVGDRLLYTKLAAKYNID
jgi:hypothetical protein